jgi:hypothetical protein
LAVKGVAMKNDDTQALVLTDNFEKLKEENKEKLLLVGKKLLSIKKLVKNEKLTKINQDINFENE